MSVQGGPITHGDVWVSYNNVWEMYPGKVWLLERVMTEGDLGLPPPPAPRYDMTEADLGLAPAEYHLINLDDLVRALEVLLEETKP